MDKSADTHSLSPGVRLGAYTIVRPLAVGGMAELYLAVPARGDRYPVALKRMLPHLAWDPEFVRMFLDEVRIVAGLDHPNIVRVLDFGIGDGSHFFAMEYVHGHTVAALQRHWKGPGPMPLEVGVAVVERVAWGLHYAHEPTPERAGLIHRDVSPSNVMIGFDGNVKLLDFGIARLSQQTQKTRAGTLKGKVGYMSPEQCKGAALDRRSDVFGLGVLLYELSIRRRAFFGDNDFAVMNKIVKGDVQPPREVLPDLPVEIERLVLDALSVDPDCRPPTAAEFAKRLGNWAQREGVDRSPHTLASFLHAKYGTVPPPSLEVPEAHEPTIAATPMAPVPRRGGWPIAATFAVGAAGFALGGFFLGRPSAPPPAPEVVTTPPVDPAPAAAPQPPPAPEEVVILGDEPDADAAPEVAPAPPRRTKRRKRKKAAKARAPEPESRPGSSVLPPSWSGEGKPR
ncbi:MAG: serine/threonine protein kinase [Nannocystaceae bacterium]|nr:serine/threonine protein kinase [bacterium]